MLYSKALGPQVNYAVSPGKWFAIFHRIVTPSSSGSGNPRSNAAVTTPSRGFVQF